MMRRLPFIILLLSFCLIASACKRPNELQNATPDSRYYVVDPVFREFYNFLGGKDVLGEVISSADGDGVTYQYTVAGLLIFDPQATPIQRFQLGSLGLDFGIPDPGGTEIMVGDPFLPLYQQLGGQAFVGKPLTVMSYNKEKNRIEQYFENLGFYQGPETDGHVRLLPYGAWRCGEECRNSVPANAAPLVQLPTRPLETSVSPTPTVELDTPQEIPAEPEVNPQAQTLPQAQPERQDQAEGHRWSVKVSQDSPVVANNQEQTVRLYLQRDGEPLADAASELILTLPDGSNQTLAFPATGINGSSSIAIEPIQAENGTKIPYEVCLSGPAADLFCVQDSFTIWTTR